MTDADVLAEVQTWLDAERRRDLRGRPVVLVAPVLAAVTDELAELRADGVDDVLVLTWGDGTGRLPEPGSARVHRLPPVRAESVQDEIRAWERLLAEPSVDVRRAVDDFDPAGKALVRLSVAVAGDQLHGRPTYGARSPRHGRLEDKTLCRDLWDAAGVHRAPEEVVAAERGELDAAARRLDAGSGTVWSADASDGMNGGAARVRHVTDEASAARARAAIVPCSRRVRVMPFLEGVPCSIHGLVTADGVLVLRPVELVMLRPEGSGRFLQGGIGSWWDPRPEDRATMRDVARRVGERLAGAEGYRGAFGIDGVLTVDGFRPHELNPRYCGGISHLGRGVPGISIADLDERLRLGGAPPVRLDRLEQALVAACDEHRYGRIYAPTSTRRVDVSTTWDVVGTPTADALSTDDVRGRLQVRQDGGEDEQVTGRFELGPASAGALVRFVPRQPVVGERLASWALAAYELADRLVGTGFGTLCAAPEVRPDAATGSAR